MQCMHCGAENDAAAQLCSKCGTMLAADEALSIGDNTTQADAGAGIAAEEVNPAMSRGDSATQVDTFGVTSKLRERFELLEELGRGGMGVVHKARDRQLGRLVALKRLNADSSENQRAIKRFRKEARSIAALDHANIVRIYNLFEDDLGICIELEYVEGGDLESLVEREGALPPEQVREVGAQLCDALALAHEKGIIHRDIKPANVLLTPRGMPKLTDFGLAQDQHGTHTMTGALLGTPLYAAPEQLKSGKHVDARSDLYALGATLYTLAVGEMPRTIRLDRVPNELRDVIGRCLEENPDQRHQAALELKEALLEGTYGRVLRQGGDCPECGFDNPIDVHFCQKCGHDLSALFAECPQCARENRKDVEFCGSCGFNLRELIEDEEEESERVPELATDEIPESARRAIRDHVNKHNGTRGSDTDWWEFSVEFYRMPGHDPVQRTQFEALVDEECRSWKEREAKRLDTEARRAEAVARRDKEAAERRRAAEEARQRVEREKRAKPHKQEAQAAEDASEWAKALASWETVVKIVPEDTTASARLQSAKEHRFEELKKQGEGLHEQGRQSEAVAVWKEALALAPGNSEFAKHVERTEQAIREVPTLLRRAEVALESLEFNCKREADALAAVGVVLELEPANQQAQKLRERVRRRLWPKLAVRLFLPLLPLFLFWSYLVYMTPGASLLYGGLLSISTYLLLAVFVTKCHAMEYPFYEGISQAWGYYGLPLTGVVASWFLWDAAGTLVFLPALGLVAWLSVLKPLELLNAGKFVKGYRYAVGLYLVAAVLTIYLSTGSPAQLDTATSHVDRPQASPQHASHQTVAWVQDGLGTESMISGVVEVFPSAVTDEALTQVLTHEVEPQVHSHWQSVLINDAGKITERALLKLPANDPERLFMDVVSNGDFVIAWLENTSNEEVSPLNVARITRDGNLAWKRIYKEEEQHEIVSIRALEDDSLLVARTKNLSVVGVPTLLKLDRMGNQEWQETYGLDADHAAGWIRSVEQTSDGGFILVLSRGGDYGDAGAYVAKLDSQGSIEWQRDFTAPQSWQRRQGVVAREISDGYVLIGTDRVAERMDGHAFLIKMDKRGKVLWEQGIYGAQRGVGLSLQPPPTQQEFDVDDWKKNLPYAFACDLKETRDGNYVTLIRAGVQHPEEPDYGDTSLHLAAWSPQGDVLWRIVVMRAPGNNHGISVHETDDGGFLVAGQRYDQFGGFLLKTVPSN